MNPNRQPKRALYWFQVFIGAVGVAVYVAATGWLLWILPFHPFRD